MPDDYDNTIDHFPDPPPAPPDHQMPLPFVPNTAPVPPDSPPNARAEYSFGGLGELGVVNKSPDFRPPPSDFRPPPPDFRPPPAAPALPPMHQGELRDMIHATTLHILDLERRVSALEVPPT